MSQSPSTVGGMATSTRLPSLSTLLDLLREERSKQISHFDALDSKSGVALGFAGLLITLAPNVHAALLAPGVVAAAVAATFALASFWPRPYPSLKPTPMRKYLTSDDRFTQLRLFDTLEVVVNETSKALEVKARRLKWSLMALAAAALLFAMGILFSRL